MARRIRVSVAWEKRTDTEGRGYAKLRWTQGGKRRTRSLGFVTTAEAEAAREHLQAELVLGLQPSGSASRPASVLDVLALYLDSIQARDVSYAVHEIKRCEHVGRHLGELAADRVTSDTLARYRAARRREITRFDRRPKQATIASEIRALRAAYRIAREKRLIDCPPPMKPTGKVEKDARPPRRLTDDEVRALIDAGHEYSSGGRRHDGVGWLVQALAWTARRPIAVLALTAQSCARLLRPELPRPEQLVYFSTDKGGEGRGWGPVSEPAREALIARVQEAGIGRLWTITDSAGLGRTFKVIARLAGVDDVQPYDLRRFGATRILRAVNGITHQAMRYTGHTHPNTLLRYAYADVGAAETAAGNIGWSQSG